MSVEEINAKEGEIIAVLEILRKETQSYRKTYLENKMELTIRRNDMAVFEFMLKLTKCKSLTSPTGRPGRSWNA